MAISKKKGQEWRAISTQWRKASDILTSTLATFLFSSHPKRQRDREAHLNYYTSSYNRGRQVSNCVKMAKRRITQTMPHDSPRTPQPLVGDPFPLKFVLKETHPTFQTQRFRPIPAYSSSTMRDSKKSSISTCFPTSTRLIVHVTLNKMRFCCFASKIQLLSKGVCYKVSLRKNFQQQSCSYIIPLSNSP